MRCIRTISLATGAALTMLVTLPATAETEQQKQVAIDAGLEWLAQTQTPSGLEGYWSYSNNGTIATTASATLAFVEEGYLPGNDVVFGATNYGDVVGRAVTYIFNQAAVATPAQGWATYGYESGGYDHYAEDYNSDGVVDALDLALGANDQAIWFDPGIYQRSLYTTGIVAPTVYALGEALGRTTVVGYGNAVVSGMTYEELMQDIVDWMSWAQVEPTQGVHRGGWRYWPNYGNSDNSTAQWGALPLLYGQAWNLGTPQHVYDELTLWVRYVQNANGGSGYSSPSTYVNMSKTGGMLLQFAALGYQEGVDNDPTPPNTVVNEVDKALEFIANSTRWNSGPYSTWFGNLNHPYAMWGVYKGLRVYGKTAMNDNGTASPLDDFLVGEDIAGVPGGFTIGQDWSPQASLAGDWYSHYCDYLCFLQKPNGSWDGYSYWTGPLATSWYINIINAQGAPVIETPPEVLCPEAVVVECAAADGTEVMLSADVYDEDGDALTVTWFVGDTQVQVDLVDATDPPPTSATVMLTHAFPLGESVLTITVEDGVLDPVSCETTVTVADTTPPVVTACDVEETLLWPPNHDLVDVGLTFEIEDVCDDATFVEVTVYADEDDDEPTGDGFHSPDAVYEDGILRLRSERLGNADGRVYLIIVSATDASGNVGWECCTVVVPKSNNKKGKQAVFAQAAAAMEFCDPFAPPPMFFLVGDGPVIGPKQ